MIDVEWQHTYDQHHDEGEERVFERMRADILAGRLRPGSRLRYAKRILQPLRDKHRRLARGDAAPLSRASSRANRSRDSKSSISPWRISAISLRPESSLRPWSFALPSLRGTSIGDTRILASHHRLSRTSQFDVADPDRLSDEWVAEHAEFHRALLDGCTNRRLKEIASSFRDYG